MSKKAWCKYARELCGIPQSELAAQLNVSVVTVKKWERRTTTAEPPQDCLDWLARAVEAHDNDVAELVDRVLAAPRGTVASLPWYPDQETADADGVGTPYGYMNAVTRSAAEQLSRLGVPAVISYPDDETALHAPRG